MLLNSYCLIFDLSQSTPNFIDRVGSLVDYCCAVSYSDRYFLPFDAAVRLCLPSVIHIRRIRVFVNPYN